MRRAGKATGAIRAPQRRDSFGGSRAARSAFPSQALRCGSRKLDVGNPVVEALRGCRERDGAEEARYPCLCEAEDMAERVKRQYSKGAIDRAGKLLIPWWTLAEDPPQNFPWAYSVIENWRNSHSMPLLVFRNGLQRRARRVEAEAIIAQRLKRFSSIMNKLSREPTMQLSQMQDLGGGVPCDYVECRSRG
jgi:hypothetical protein